LRQQLKAGVRRTTNNESIYKMTEHISTSSPRLQARIAGFIYLIIIFVGGFGYYTGSALIDFGDASATASNIMASEQLWRLGFVALLVMLACDVGVAVIFYVLFKPVNRTLALLGFAFRLVMTAILGVNMLARFAPLLLLRDVASSASFRTDQMQALALLSVKLFEQGFIAALVFFGVDCLVIGWLIFRSTFLPRILGVLLAVAGLCYLTNSIVDFVFPALTLPSYFLVPSYVIELALSLWLIVMGVNAEKWKEQAAATRGRRA
jgi:hypothetical protein